MKKQTAKNYICLFDNIKEEDGDIIYKTTLFNKLPGGCRGVNDKGLIEHYKETYDLKFNQIFNNTQRDLRDRFSDRNTPLLCWLTIFDCKVWP